MIKAILKGVLGAVGAILYSVTPSGADGYSDPIVEPGISALSQEEADCQKALKANTIEALEAYLAKYPYGDSNCRTRVVAALEKFQGQGGSAVPPGPGTTQNNYGQADGGYGG